MSENGGRVVVVDGDYDTLVSIATALRMRGHQVALATDGRSGLQQAVDNAAEVVLVDSEIRILDVRAFLEVLWDNPRTASAHVFILGHGDASRLLHLAARAEPLVKPFNPEEVASRVDEVLRLRHAPSREPEVQGDIAQVALFDLLQVFAQNRRTGKLELETGYMHGNVWVRDGRIVDATIGMVSGEKAVYRILAAETGQFAFFPDVAATQERVTTSLDHLLMESVRRKDEIARVTEELPPLASLVDLQALPDAPSDRAADVLDCLEEPRTIVELLDLVPGHDLETLELVLQMIRDHTIKVLDATERMEFCNADEVAMLRAAAIRLRSADIEGTVRLGVVAPSSAEIMHFARALRAVVEFVPPAEPPVEIGEALLGAVGTLRLGGTELELFAVPFAPDLRPLWGAFLGAATTLLVLDPRGEALSELVAPARALDLNLVPGPDGYDRTAGAVRALKEVLGTTVTRTYAAPR